MLLLVCATAVNASPTFITATEGMHRRGHGFAGGKGAAVGHDGGNDGPSEVMAPGTWPHIVPTLKVAPPVLPAVAMADPKFTNRRLLARGHGFAGGKGAAIGNDGGNDGPASERAWPHVGSVTKPSVPDVKYADRRLLQGNSGPGGTLYAEPAEYGGGWILKSRIRAGLMPAKTPAVTDDQASDRFSMVSGAAN